MAPKKAAGAGKGKAKASNPKTSQHKVRKSPPRMAKTAGRTVKAATPDDGPAAEPRASRKAAPQKAAPKKAVSKATTSKASASSAKAPKAKARKAKAPKNPRHVRKGNFQSNNGVNYVLTTTAEVQDHDEYDSCKRVELSLKLRRGKAKGVDVDCNFVAWIVDKTVQDPEARPLWIPEFLEQGEVDEEDQTLELRQIVRLLYLKSGTPRKAQELKNNQEGLSEEKLIFLDTLELPDEHRGTGLASRALADFHSIVQEDLEASLIVLSPAKGAGSVWRDHTGRDLTEVEIEQRLIRLYRNNGYEVWIQGKAKGGETVMGQVLGEEDE